MKVEHADLIRLGKKFNCHFEQGCCFGYNAVWEEYYFTQELPTLYTLLDIIATHKHNFDEIFVILASIQTKIRRGHSLSYQEWLYSEIPALFSTIFAYFSPKCMEEFQDKLLSQMSAKSIYTYHQQSSTQAIWSYCYAFTFEKLNDFLTDFSNILTETNQPWVLNICSNNHIVSVAYDRQKDCWIYVDVNDYSRFNWLFPEVYDYLEHLPVGSTNSVDDFAGFLLNKYPKLNHAYLKEQIHEIYPYSIQVYEQIKQPGYDISLFLSCCKGYHREVNTENLVRGLFLSLTFEDVLHIELQLKARNPLPATVKLLNDLLQYYPLDSFQSTHLTAQNDSLILLAAQHNDTFALEHLLNQSTQLINHKNDKDDFPLSAAALQGYVKIAKMLLSRECHVNQTQKDGTTPLFHAIALNQKSIARLLLKHGANVNHVNNEGNTPLYFALLIQSESLVGLLLDAGADVNYVNEAGDPLLHTALYFYHEQIIELLLNAGADADIVKENKKGKTALDIAVIGNNECALKKLLQYYHSTNPDHLSDLFRLAFVSGRFSIATLLLQKGADINATDSKGDTPLEYACRNNYLEGIHYLLENKVSTDIVSPVTGFTLIHFLSLMNLYGPATLILKKVNKELINKKDKWGWTPLCFSFIECLKDHKQTALFTLLLIYRADLLSIFMGMTILDHAVCSLSHPIPQQLQMLINTPQTTIDNLNLMSTSPLNTPTFFKPNLQSVSKHKRIASYNDLGWIKKTTIGKQ